MNKIVRNHYPVEQLPRDLRESSDRNANIRVIVEQMPPAISEERLLELLDLARRVEPIGDDPVERIRKLRDEWED